jgi:glycosyltransferase involved in cell wall biosynthesis
MSTTLLEQPAAAHVPAPSTVEIVVPVFNEAHDLEPNTRRLRDYLDTRFPVSAVITIADNASSDGTWEIAHRLERTMRGVRAVRLDEKGRGRAVRQVWSSSESAVVCYMDVDLATGLDGLLPLVAPILSGHAELSIGSRLANGARVVRGPKRELISRAYNLTLRLALGNRFSDAQCGFKAVRTDIARRLLPMVVDEEWFFDTELLVVAEQEGLRIHEVPVDWVDDPDSRVHIPTTISQDLRGIWRLLTTRGRVHRSGLRNHRQSPAGAGR